MVDTLQQLDVADWAAILWFVFFLAWLLYTARHELKYMLPALFAILGTMLCVAYLIWWIVQGL